MTSTIIDRLETAATRGGGHIVLHDHTGAQVYGARDAFDMARIRAARLRDAGVARGQRVGIIGPNSRDWIAWAHATWMCGAAIVPLPIPLRVRDPEAVVAHVNAMTSGFECDRVAAHERFASFVRSDLLVGWNDIGSLTDAVALTELERVDDDTLARIVPTSGSTSAPKGVSRSYRLLNRRELRHSMNPLGIAEVRHLSYSPLAHAGGSTAMFAHLEPWLELHMLAPERFARDPGELFRLVGRHKITSVTGASSAFAAALRSIENRPDNVDLSSLAALTFAFEMVDPEVIDRLLEVGTQLGLRPEALSASYGLSEGGQTRTVPGHGVPIDEIDLDELVTFGRASGRATDRPYKRVASCGRPRQFELRIIGRDGPAPERHVGEVQFRGERLMQGYVGPGAEEAFVDNGWMHTGDVGYLANGDLYLTGRIKEVLVRQGKKYHPEDIERAVARGAQVAPDGCVAFVPVDASEGEIVTIVETAQVGELGELERRVRAAVLNAVGVTLREVVFVAPMTLPKTSSGKAQRLAVRDQHAHGELCPNL